MSQHEPLDVYADQVEIGTTPWGTNIAFSRSAAFPDDSGRSLAQPDVVVRMSHEHAKAFVMMLRQQLRDWELRNVEIPVPVEVLEKLNVNPADW